MTTAGTFLARCQDRAARPRATGSAVFVSTTDPGSACSDDPRLLAS